MPVTLDVRNLAAVKGWARCRRPGREGLTYLAPGGTIFITNEVADCGRDRTAPGRPSISADREPLRKDRHDATCAS